MVGRVFIAALTALALAGCSARRVQVSLPAGPALQLDTTSVAVVSNRECREVANALVREIDEVPGFHVDHRSPVRLYLSACERWVDPTIDIQQTVDADDGVVLQRRRVSIRGGALAVLSVMVAGQPTARLIGRGRQSMSGEWNSGMDVFGLSRRVERDMMESVVADLIDQLSPVPRLVERRVFPNASEGSPRGLHTAAVRAEMAGELEEAYKLALRAYEVTPTRQARLYLDELDRSLHRLTPQSHPSHD